MSIFSHITVEKAVRYLSGSNTFLAEFSSLAKEDWCSTLCKYLYVSFFYSRHLERSFFYFSNYWSFPTEQVTQARFGTVSVRFILPSPITSYHNFMRIIQNYRYSTMSSGASLGARVSLRARPKLASACLLRTSTSEALSANQIRTARQQGTTSLCSFSDCTP